MTDYPKCAGPHCRDPKCDLCAPAVDAGKPAKCDGNHGGPRCADPECWNDSPPDNSDGRFSIGSPTREWGRIGPNGRHLEAFCLNTVREDAPAYPMAAMLLGVYERGHTNGRLGEHSNGREVRVPLERSYDTRVKMLLAFNTSRQAGFDVDEALEAAWQALLRFSNLPAAYAAEEPERTRYERWVKGEWPLAPLKFIRDALPTKDPRYGEYVDPRLQHTWVGWQARAMHAPAPKLPEGTEQVSSAWLAQLRQEYREYGQRTRDLEQEVQQLRAERAEAKAAQHQLLTTIENLNEQIQRQRLDINASEEQLAQCMAMVAMVEENEWAEHTGTGPVSSAVETAFTQLHNELAELRDRPTLAYGIAGNRYMVKPTRGELPDVYEDAQVIELVRGRPYTRQEPQA